MNISVRFSAAWKGFTGEAAQLIRACREEILSLKRQLAESELELQESKTVISGQRAVIEDFAAARTYFLSPILWRTCSNTWQPPCPSCVLKPFS